MPCLESQADSFLLSHQGSQDAEAIKATPSDQLYCMSLALLGQVLAMQIEL